MTKNELVNGSFEDGWEHGIEDLWEGRHGWHSFRPRIDEDPPGVQEIKVPLGGWQVAYADATVENPYWDGEEHNLFTRPEFDVKHRSGIPVHEQPDYFRHGDWCVKVFGKAWMAGYYQKVDLPPGRGTLEIPLFPDLVFEYKDGEKVWAPDPLSGNIRAVIGDVRTDWYPLTAGYRHVTKCPLVRNKSTSTRVGFELLCPFALANSGFFIDDVTLTWEPTANEQRYFDRAINVAPQDMTVDESKEVVASVLAARGTLTHSMDEAVLNAAAFKSRMIQLHGTWQRHGFENASQFLQWAGKHHPPAPQPDDVAMIPFTVTDEWSKYLYLQCDPAWGSKPFGSTAYKTTLCKEGCYLTGIAMAINILDDEVTMMTPAMVVNELDEDDYVTGTARVWWAAVESKLDIRIQRLGATDPRDWLSDGNLLLARVNHKNNEHWVLAVEWDGRDYTILNPLTGWIGRLHIEYPEGATAWRKLSLVEEAIQPPVTLPLPAETVTFHIQKEVNGLRRYFNRVQPEWVLLVGNAEWSHWLKGEGVKNIAYRRHEDNQRPWYALEGFNSYRDAAEDWVAGPRYALEHNPIDCYLGLNEEIPTGDLVKLWRVMAFERALSDYCFSIWGSDKAAALIGAAVGNPEHSEVTEMLEVAASAYAHGHFIHYHGYGPCHPDYWLQWTKNEGYHYHLRDLLSYDPIFAAAGYFPAYLNTECGPIGAEPTMKDGLWRPGGMNAAKGWRHPDCLNGNVEHMLQWTEITREQKLDWNKANGNRYRGSCHFTINQGEGSQNWPHFQYSEYELDAMAEMFS